MSARKKTEESYSPCKKCKGLGWREVNDGEYPEYTRYIPCECKTQKEMSTLLSSARIPNVYGDCSFANFKISPKADASIAVAKRIAQDFAAAYLPGKNNRGILFMGPPGGGKTHLAVSILKELAATKGVPCLFRDFSKLLFDIRATYNAQARVSESELLEPLYIAEILLLDDIGAVRTTDWVLDILYSVINNRYSEQRTTLFTTNYLDKYPSDDSRETLEERIGPRIRSRLFEMCLRVEMEGADYRRSGKPKLSRL